MKQQKLQKVVIVKGDDWQGIYVDSKLRYEDHSIRPDKILEILGINHKVIDCDYDWLEKRGRLPENLKQVKITK